MLRLRSRVGDSTPCLLAEVLQTRELVAVGLGSPALWHHRLCVLEEVLPLRGVRLCPSQTPLLPLWDLIVG